MKWKKGRLIDEEGNGIDCWRSDCGEYLFYLNINKGSETKKGKADRSGHRWWYEITKVPSHKKLRDIKPTDETHIGEAPTPAGAKEVAACDKEGM